jgi:hypothetical protein
LRRASQKRSVLPDQYVCGCTFTKPSAEDAGSGRWPSAAVDLYGIYLNIKRGFKSGGDGHDQTAFDPAWRCVVIVSLFSKSTPPHCFCIIPSYLSFRLSAIQLNHPQNDLVMPCSVKSHNQEKGILRPGA